jgi:hypothetical protein
MIQGCYEKAQEKRGDGMSVLIRGIEMPQGNSTINVLIYADGTVYTGHVNDSRCSAVSVPTPYGRLVDADAFDERVRVAGGMSEEELTEDFKDGVQTVLYMMSKQPTIIEAEGSEA